MLANAHKKRGRKARMLSVIPKGKGWFETDTERSEGAGTNDPEPTENSRMAIILFSE